ncbi:MAG: Fic family protein [Desulfovibrionaceae bacterium]
MSKKQPQKQPRNNTNFLCGPILPGQRHLGPLKDRAQEVIDASARLEGRVAPATALVLGDHLRLINSYYSNLIEGHKTTIPEIVSALARAFTGGDERRYAQELCAAHVRTEKEMMARVHATPGSNVSDAAFLCDVHRTFYSHLPPEHLFTHGEGGFSAHLVQPGTLRDTPVSVGLNREPIGPAVADVRDAMDVFALAYDPGAFHGDERLIAMAAAHHRLTWLHPFRDGNGRVSRLYSGLFMARCHINTANLWSLSRGLSRAKNEYMVNLFSVDPAPRDDQPGETQQSELLADFCDFFLGICLDQIHFMDRLLRLEEIEQRIEWYVETRSRGRQAALHPKASRLLRALFMRGAIDRSEGPAICNASDSGYRRIVRQLEAAGLVTATTQRAPLQVALPPDALPYYFPELYEPSVIGREYAAQLTEGEPS